MSTPYSKESFSDPDYCVVGDVLIGKGQSIKGSKDYKLKLDAVCGIKDEVTGSKDKLRRRLELKEFKPIFEEGKAIKGSWITVKESRKKEQEKVAMHSAQHNAQQAKFESLDGEARGHIIQHSRIDKEAIPENIARAKEIPDEIETVFLGVKLPQETIDPGKAFNIIEKFAEIENQKWLSESFALKLKLDEDKKDHLIDELREIYKEDLEYEIIDK